MENIQLIVGLGNPGPEYTDTRHNAGEWYLTALASQLQVKLQRDKKLHGHTGTFFFDGQPVRLLVPSTYMNNSGTSVAQAAGFYKIRPQAILVAHDELDLPPGIVRLKSGGGPGGHNGLKDIIQKLGQKDFLRLRIGIGHPGHRERVLGYVLGKAPQPEQNLINHSIEESLKYTQALLRGDIEKVMNHLHRFDASRG